VTIYLDWEWSGLDSRLRFLGHPLRQGAIKRCTAGLDPLYPLPKIEAGITRCRGTAAAPAIPANFPCRAIKTRFLYFYRPGVIAIASYLHSDRSGARSDAACRFSGIRNETVNTPPKSSLWDRIQSFAIQLRKKQTWPRWASIN
jgi:hypothetical protein